MRSVNVFEVETEPATDKPDGYRNGRVRLGPAIGAADISGSVWELPPGQATCPYHYEYGNEEWLLVISGRPTLRHPGGEDQLAPGDVVCFPEGPDGAHKITNTTDETVRVLLLATDNEPAVAVYPDSNKIGLWSGGEERDELMVRRGENLDYWDGER